jgi:hypothetical protein
MAEAKYRIDDMAAVLDKRLLPSITVWNRLEGRPRSVEFGRALKAEVRDALWMLTRQWQLGEFRGDDAGSPILARYQVSDAPLTGYQARDAAPVGYDPAIPLEATVERRDLALLDAAGLGGLDLRLMLGRRFLKLIPSGYTSAFVGRYAFVVPDPDDGADTERVAHLDVWSTLQALAGRALDGLLLYRYLTAAPANRPWDGLTVLDADKPALQAAGVQLVQWFDALFVRPPAAEGAWDPQRLEHRFAVTTGVADGDKRLVAEEYPGGRLDWTAFSIDPDGARGSGAFAPAATMIPTGTRFDGMPNTRWWSFEDGRTNLGDIRADTTDLARLLFIEFALVYGNDWFTIPVSLPVGSLARVEGLAVTNVFGERLWIEAAGRGEDDDWARWSMFTLDIAGVDREPADTSLLVAPTVPQTSTSEPLEDVRFLRDEIANMVWGVEQVVPLATGVGRRGAEAAAETLAHRTRLVEEAGGGGGGAGGGSPVPAAPIRYQVMNTVPENWIPFVPVHVPGDIRETQLQRAAMPRLIEGDPAPTEKVRPRTTLLREGLDAVPAVAYFVHEEEVPRAGTQVQLVYQRTRWRNGKVVLWLAAQRQTSRGEASSALAFDQLIPTEMP